MGFRRTASGLVLGLLAFADPVMAQAVAEVQVSPPTVTISAGQEGGVFATAYDANGNVLVGQSFRWTSSNPNVVRVTVDPASSDVASLVAVSPGVARVEARIGNRAGTAAVQVVGPGGVPPGGGGPPVGSGPATVLRIEPGNILMLAAESRQLIPVFLTNDGSPAAPTTVTWRSLNAAVANVSGDGLVVAISQGQGIIEATTSNGLVARAPIQVSAAPFSFSASVLSLSPGTEATIEVVVPSQGGRSLPNNALTWRSSNEAVVRVTPLGVAQAVSAGQATISASGFLQEQSVPVTVHRPVTDLSLLPRSDAGPVAAPLGGTVQFTVQALAADGTPVTEAPFAWTVRDTTIATFDRATATLRGKAIGETELHLRGPGPDVLEVTWQINVIAGGLLADPRRVGIGVGDTVAVSASFTDQTGSPISAATGVTWSSLAPDIAAVTGSGIITGLAFGRAAVVAATPWDAVDTVSVFVQGELLISSTRAGSPDLYTLDRANPGVMSQITSDAAVEVSGSISPDGSRVAFVSNRDGNLEIYVANADGSDPVRLTDNAAAEDAPVWTPDGRELVYVSQAPGQKAQIWIMAADGSGARALTEGLATNFEPAVSPSGRTIAFTSTRDGNYEIYLMDRDGSNQRNVTQSPLKESHAAWFPDGQLAFINERIAGNTVDAKVIRANLTSGATTVVSPEGLAVTDFAVSGSGDLLALEVSEFASGGGITRKVMLIAPGAAGQAVEVPRQSAAEQHSGPAFRPQRAN